MVEKRELTIQNKLGLHARAAAVLVQTVNKFKSEVFIEKDGYRVNAKSIMGVMMLAAAKGSKIVVDVSGSDALQVVEDLERLVADNFGEAE